MAKKCKRRMAYTGSGSKAEAKPGSIELYRRIIEQNILHPKEARLEFGRLKDNQIQTTGASYCIAGCHNCHAQIPNWWAESTRR